MAEDAWYVIQGLVMYSYLCKTAHMHVQYISTCIHLRTFHCYQMKKLCVKAMVHSEGRSRGLCDLFMTLMVFSVPGSLHCAL